MAVEAGEAGRGGITMVARATGAARSTVTRGVDELDSGATDSGRVRRAGAGRKRAETVDAELTSALERLVDPDTRGDPESPLRWTIKSTRQLVGGADRSGAPVQRMAGARLLHDTGYSLQAAAEQIEGTAHPDRDAQFRYVNDQVREHRFGGAAGDQRGHQEEGTGRQFKNGGEPVAPERKPGAGEDVTTSRTNSWARRSRTASTTSPPTPAGCPSASTTTPPRSPWPRSAAGGRRSAPTVTRTLRSC